MADRTAVYRLFDASDRLLYLGISDSPEFRWKAHSDKQTWWHLVTRKTIEWYPDRAAAKAAEVRLTAIENPLYDRAAKKQSQTVRYDNTADVERAKAWLLNEIAAYQPGWQIGTGEAARACNVARASVATALYELANDGRLKGAGQGLFEVTGAQAA